MIVGHEGDSRLGITRPCWAADRNTPGDRGLVPDAHLAALAIEHGLAVASADSDVARFPEVRWENPLR
jgi:predicted nucleic acid-binding protein